MKFVSRFTLQDFFRLYYTVALFWI